MADGNVVIKIDGDDSGFADKLTKVSASANDLGDKALKVMGKGLAAGAAALTASGLAATVAGKAYETAFAKTMTIMDDNVVSAQDMSGAIVDLSNETGQAAATLSGSVYDAISATGDTAHAVGLVADASKLATAGFAENGDALSVLTTITNAYGMEVDKAAAISDSLIQTQNLGVTTVGQLASSMGKAIATAAAYSVDLYNLEAAYVATTKAGISTEESTTYLSSMFKELGDSGSDVAKVIQNKTGKSFGTLMKEGVSLGDVLDILLDSVNGDTEALMNLWGSAEAGKAASAIAGQGIKSFNANLDSLRNSAGTTEKAYETMTQTLGYQTDLLKTRITNLGTAVYSHFNAGMTAGVSSLSDAFLELTNSVTDGALSASMEHLSQGVENLISTGAELVSSVLPKVIEAAAWVLDNGGTIVTVVGGVTASIVAYKVAAVAAKVATEGFTVALNASPWGLAAAGIALVVTGAIALSDILGQLTPEQQEAADAADEAAAAASSLAEEIEGVKTAYAGTKDEIASNAKANAELIASLVELTTGYDGTASKAEEIRQTIEKLNSAVPGLNLEFDEQAGVLNKTTEELQALNEQYEAQQNFTAAIEQRTTATEQHEQAVKQLEAAEKAHSEAEAALTEYVDTYSGSLVYNRKRLEALQEAEKEAAQAVDDNRNSVAAAAEEMKLARMDVDTYGKQLDDATDKVNSFAEETEESADALDEQDQAAKEATQSVAKIALKAQDAVQSGKNLGDTYEDLRKELDDLKGSGDPYIESLAEQALKQLDAAAKAEELGAKYGELSSTIGVSTAEVAAYLAVADMSFEEFSANAANATDSTINGFSKMSTSLDMSLSEMAANLEANIQATSSWNDNIAILWNAAVASGQAGATEFVKQLYDMGPSAAAQVAQMVNDVDGTLDTFAPLFASAGAEGVEQAALGAAMAADVAYDSGVATGDMIAQGTAEADTSGASQQLVSSLAGNITAQAPAVQAAASELAMTAHSAMAQVGWADLGSAVGTGISNGLTAQTGAVQTAAQTLAQSVSDAWTRSAAKFRQSGTTAANMLRTGLTSQKSSVTSAGRSLADGVTSAWAQSSARFQSAGTAASAAIAGGISSGSGGITSAAASAASSAYSAVYGLGWYSLGYNISAGIASGVRAGSGLITSAARSAAYSALRAAKSSLDIHSPSRVFEKQVGMMIPGGIAVGVQKGTPKAEKAVELSADQLLRATQIALRPSGSVSPAQSITNNTAYYGGSSGDGVLKAEAPVIIQLNDREVGRGVAKFTGQRMAYLGGLS